MAKGSTCLSCLCEPHYLMRQIVGLLYVSANLQNIQHTGLKTTVQRFDNE